MVAVLSCLFHCHPMLFSKCLNRCLSFRALSLFLFVYAVYMWVARCVCLPMTVRWGKPLGFGRLLGISYVVYLFIIVFTSTTTTVPVPVPLTLYQPCFVNRSLATFESKQAALRRALLFECWSLSLDTHSFIQQNNTAHVFWKVCFLSAPRPVPVPDVLRTIHAELGKWFQAHGDW